MRPEPRQLHQLLGTIRHFRPEVDRAGMALGWTRRREDGEAWNQLQSLFSTKRMKPVLGNGAEIDRLDLKR